MASKSRNQKVVNRTASSTIASDARVARSFISRLVGLLASPPLCPGEGLIIDPCSSIHMFGMKFALDAIFLDRQMRVVGLVESLQPGQMSRLFPGARLCIELPTGTISDTGTKLGDQIGFEDA